MQPLAPSVRTVWTIQSALWIGVLLVGAFVFDLVRFFGGGESALPPGLLTGSMLVGGGAYVLVLPRLRYRFWRYDLRPEALYLERGVVNRIRTVVPLRRIQHLDVSQNLLEREFDLGKLIVHTAGTRSSDVVLPGLRYEEAEHLRETVKQYVLEDAV